MNLNYPIEDKVEFLWMRRWESPHQENLPNVSEQINPISHE